MTMSVGYDINRKNRDVKIEEEIRISKAIL